MILNELVSRLLLSRDLNTCREIELECQYLRPFISHDGYLSITQYNHLLIQNECSVWQYLQVLDRILTPTGKFCYKDLYKFVDKYKNLW